jgi:membrane fusion protein, multidrug efflux system
VLTKMRYQSLTVPATALERGPDGMFAYLVQPDSTVAVAPVSASEPVGNLVVIDKGLKAGDQVVTSNHYRLQPGARIRPNAAATTGAPEPAP